jgi:hypothetical protein
MTDWSGEQVVTRVERDRAALRTQLAALEDYYRMATVDLVTQRRSNALPDRVPRSEAARWAELQATLDRLDAEASPARTTIEEWEAERSQGELEAA